MNNIIIIGASSGLGQRLATEFARRGWRVGVCARRLEPLRELYEAYPDNIVYSTLDVTTPDAAEQFNDLIAKSGGMDTLLYAAGCGWNNPSLEQEFDRRTVTTNVDGFTTIVHAAFRYFRDNGRKGHIAAITSVAATRGIGISATYSASKRYQVTLLEALDQLARQQKLPIRFTDIRPGFIDTALLDTKHHKYPMLMTVDYAAPRIMRAIIRGRRIATIDTRWAIVTALWRRLPRVLWRHISLKN